MNANFSLKHSEQINEIASALAKAQGEMKPAVFNRVNPHFKNKYADFTSCMEACRGPLSSNGLAVTQLPSFTSEGKFILNTLLLHSSGQWMSCEFPMNTKNDNIQAVGSAMSYAKRYSLCGMLGIVADEDLDDDGNNAAQVKIVHEIPTKLPARIESRECSLLKEIEAKLTADYKSKIYTWMEKQYGFKTIEDITVDAYQKIFGSFENAYKLIQSEKKETVHA